MNPKRVVIVGGSGFIGSAIANRLCEAGVKVLIPTRRRSRAGHVLLLPNAEVVEADVHDPAALARLFEDADAVINTVGVLHSRPGTPFGPDFARAHVELPQKIVTACRTAGVARLVHISALGADANGPSEYQRSKAAGEHAIEAAGPDIAWTILRPSVVFGRGDSFLNLFADLARMFPVLPLTGASCRFQPVYVEDVAEAVYQSLTRPDAAGQTFELAGPTVYTLRQLVEYVSALIGKPRPVLGLPEGIGMVQARLMELAPQPLMSRDNVRSMRVDNVASGEPQPFGLTPTALEAVAPGWLGTAGPRAFYYPFRRHARR
ncbi:MAG: complex I NDUFA9 subunit family protein [Thauera sp.]|nr:complex I NDUFA9 subunit family protein [Thauera sp.]